MKGYFMTFRLTAPCHFGLEKTLSFEVRKIGGEDIAVSDGRVTFTGDERVLIRANMCLSTAERVGILLSEFKARTFEELFQGVKAIPIEKYVGKFDKFPIKGFSLNSKLTSVPACQKIIKKAMVERMKSVYKIGYFQETEALFQFRFSIMKDNVTMTLDTSGEGLHKRGYRRTYKGNACGGNRRPCKDKRQRYCLRPVLRKRNTAYRERTQGAEYSALP